MSEQFLLCVIICTYNRADLLARTIASLRNQSVNKSIFEIIVVDNCSTDNTRSLVEELQKAKGLNIQYHYEAHQGLSFARNTGMLCSNARYLLYLDDDIFADPGLIQAYLNFLGTSEMVDIACLGGRVLIDWENGQKPDWFPERFLNLYGYFDLGSTVVKSTYVLGGNMLWKKDILIAFGGFSTDLGRIGHKKLASEETELMEKVINSGYEIKYIPGALVHHWTPKERQTREYLYNMCYWLGISTAISESKMPMRLSSRLKHILYSLRYIFIVINGFFIAKFDANKTKSASDLVYFTGKVSYEHGYLQEWFKMLMGKPLS